MTLTPIDKLEQSGANARTIHPADLYSIPPQDEGAGLFTSNLADGTRLDGLLVKKKSEVLVVSLHGATNRHTTRLPRFERLRTLLQYDVCSLYFSDPALALNERLQLAWYTGWKNVYLQHEISRITSQIAASLGLSTILFTGASGGGFAALQISALTPGSTALAFNAQTDISKYLVNGTAWGAQRDYLQIVWPEIYEAYNLSQNLQVGDWTEAMDDRISAVSRYSTQRENTVIVVQNTQEFHYHEHHLPFVTAARRAGNTVIESTNQEGALHNPPRAATFTREFEATLNGLRERGKLASIETHTCATDKTI